MPVKEISYKSPSEVSSGSLQARRYGESQDGGVPKEHSRWLKALSEALVKTPADTRNVILTELANLQKNKSEEFGKLGEKMSDLFLRPKSNKLDVVDEVMKALKLKK